MKSLAYRSLKKLLQTPVLFVEKLGGIEVRGYQRGPVEAIAKSVTEGRGDTIVVEWARQAGKNEIQAQIQAYFLVLFQEIAGEMVIVSPTFKPQTMNAMRRLKRVLDQNLLTRDIWKKEGGYIFRIGSALVLFFSGQKEANVVGATASVLLLVDEAQDVLIPKFDKEFAPMGASTNVTTVFMGTAWISKTLLARERKLALEAEKKDGVKRVFQADANEVAAAIPAYGRYVQKQIAKLGRQHPIIKTQYFLEEIDATGGMFPPARRALTQGEHSPQESPTAGKIYAITIDVAGEDEEAEGAELRETKPRKDSTTLTVAEVDLESLYDEMIGAPTYKIVKRHVWTGTRHVKLYGQIRAICEHWGAAYVVVDKSGVGEPLYSYLDNQLRFSAVMGIQFTSTVKSDMGYRYLAAVDSGRFRDYNVNSADGLAKQFQNEMEYCQYEIKPGPAKRMAWGVPENQRNQDGKIVHDDLLIGGALFSELDGEEWPGVGEIGTTIIQGKDPLQEIDQSEW